jgi:hypothetical protein
MRAVAIAGAIAALAAGATASGLQTTIGTTASARSTPPSKLPRAGQRPVRHDAGDRLLIPGDDSRFIADVSIPDGTTVRAGQTFVKTWSVENTGTVPWRGRYLQRQGLVNDPGVCASAARVAIPPSLPGQVVDISVRFTAPRLPGSCRVDWKMTDGRGRAYFPGLALYLLVNVTT